MVHVVMKGGQGLCLYMTNGPLSPYKGNNFCHWCMHMCFRLFVFSLELLV
jgi:hypothetical protein